MFFVFLVDLSKATLRCYTSICDGIIFLTIKESYSKGKRVNNFHKCLRSGQGPPPLQPASLTVKTCLYAFPKPSQYIGPKQLNVTNFLMLKSFCRKIVTLKKGKFFSNPSKIVNVALTQNFRSSYYDSVPIGICTPLFEIWSIFANIYIWL